MSEEKEGTRKKLYIKIISIVCTCLTVILVALTCYMFISICVARAKNKPVNLFGLSIAIVQTASMEPEIKVGDMIIFNLCDFSEVKVGDDVVFKAAEGFDNSVLGKNIVHRAIMITDEGVVTKGINNPVADKPLLTADNFLGICTYHSSFWGKIFSFIGKYGILIIILIVALYVIVTQSAKIVRLLKERKAEKLSAGSADGGEVPGLTNGESEGADVFNGNVGACELLDNVALNKDNSCKNYADVNGDTDIAADSNELKSSANEPNSPSERDKNK